MKIKGIQDFSNSIISKQYPEYTLIIGKKSRLGNGYKDVLLIMHESMHLSLEIHGTDLTYKGVDIEEIAITWAEENSDSIYQFLRSQGIL